MKNIMSEIVGAITAILGTLIVGLTAWKGLIDARVKEAEEKRKAAAAERERQDKEAEEKRKEAAAEREEQRKREEAAKRLEVENSTSWQAIYTDALTFSKQETQRLIEKVEVLTVQTEEKQKQITDLQVQHALHAEQVVNIAQEISKLHSDNRKLLEDNERLTKENETLRNENALLRSENAEIIKGLDDLTKQVEELKQEPRYRRGGKDGKESGGGA